MSEDGEFQSTRTSPRVDVPEDVVILVESFGQFLEQHAQDISEGGMFLRSAAPPPVGSRLRFAIRLADGYALIRGEGEVVWCRERDAGPESPRGMGIRFVELEEQGRELVHRLVEERRGGTDAEEPGKGEAEQPEAAEQPPETGEPIEMKEAAPPPSVAEVEELSEPFGELISKLEERMAGAQESGPFTFEPERPSESESTAEAEPLFPPVSEEQDLSGQGADGGGTGFREADEERLPPVVLPEIGKPAGFYDDDDGEDVEGLPPSRSRWFWLFAIPVLILALVALGYGAWQMGLLGWVGLPGPASSNVVEGPVVTPQQSVPALEQATPTPEATEETEIPGSSAAVAASPTTESAPPSPTPVPTATERPAPRAVAARASAVQDVTWRKTSVGVEVRIQLNGRIDQSAVNLTRLDNPPRGLLRIKHMRTHYEPTEIAVGVGGLEKVRLWLHDELRPPQMYVVFDLSEPSRRLTQSLEDGDLVITVR